MQIVVTFSGDLIGKLGRLLNLAYWTHAALRYKKNSEWRIFESSFCGIVERDWNSFIKEKEGYAILKVKGLNEELSQRAVDYSWGNVGKPYAFHWLIKILIRLIKEKLFLSPIMYKWHVCSSFVDHVLDYVGIDLLPEKDILVTPDEIFDSPLVEVVETDIKFKK